MQERAKKEKEEEIERIRLRHQHGKAATEQLSKLQEEARKRALAQLEREKEVRCIQPTSEVRAATKSELVCYQSARRKRFTRAALLLQR